MLESARFGSVLTAFALFDFAQYYSADCSWAATFVTPTRYAAWSCFASVCAPSHYSNLSDVDSGCTRVVNQPAGVIRLPLATLEGCWELFAAKDRKTLSQRRPWYWKIDKIELICFCSNLASPRLTMLSQTNSSEMKLANFLFRSSHSVERSRDSCPRGQREFPAKRSEDTACFVLASESLLRLWTTGWSWCLYFLGLGSASFGGIAQRWFRSLLDFAYLAKHDFAMKYSSIWLLVHSRSASDSVVGSNLHGTPTAMEFYSTPPKWQSIHPDHSIDYHLLQKKTGFPFDCSVAVGLASWHTSHWN